MNDLQKLIACAAISVAVHGAAARALEFLPEQPLARPPQKVEVRVVTPPPEPPKLEPEPPKPEPTPEPIKPAPKLAPVQHAASTPKSPTPPKPDTPTPNTPPADQVFDGGAIGSTSTGGGLAMPAGSPGGNGGGGGSAAPPPGPKPQAAAAPIPDYQATTLPMPQGRCAGKYTDDARAAGVEGRVVLDFVVGEDGRVRDIEVTQKLGHGLDQAAVAALRACSFTPGEKDGKRAAIKVHGFKVTFVLSEASP